MVRQAQYKSEVRTRMAPSPTGEYHIGHIRTLLYNWAFAKKNKGKFIIRIEDTDRERYVKGATDKILDVIKDYGFDWDEGPRVGGKYAPYIQSERLEIYKKYAEELVREGKAYYCFCTEERLAKMREEQKRRGFPSTKYDRFCLSLSRDEVEKNLKEGKPYVIRLKVPDNKKISFEDLVFGKISYDSSDLDDQVLLKSDGFPTYHLGVVVDDHLMKISHVMRGNDWIPSTPKHILLYEAFGWKPPIYIHLPNLKELGSSKKLSKRFGPVSAREFLDQGYLPEAVVNFLMFLGWNPGGEREIYALEEFVKDFSVKKIHKTDLVSFDRSKLDWVNGEYIRRTENSKLKTQIFGFLDKKYPEDLIEKTIPLVKERIIKLSDYLQMAGFFFRAPKVDKKLFGENFREHLKEAKDVIDNMTIWNTEKLGIFLLERIDRKKFHKGNFFMDLRIAITGSKFTPPINDSIVILGKEETLHRIEKVLSSKF